MNTPRSADFCRFVKDHPSAPVLPLLFGVIVHTARTLRLTRAGDAPSLHTA